MAHPVAQVLKIFNPQPSNPFPVDRDYFGIHVLADGVDPVVDIVAIHGLDGHPLESWMAGNGKIWLRDFLPDKVPRARILTYGYDAYTRGRPQLTHQSIYDHAETLVTYLASERKEFKTEHRPIIFVAHSLGGNVLKYACHYHTDAQGFANYSVRL
jgi:predicted alpha/beta-fold hydrolase